MPLERESFDVIISNTVSEHHYIYPNGDEVSNIDIVYLCKEYSGELKPQANEVKELRFFHVNELPQNLSPPVKVVIEQWAAQAHI